MTEEFALLDENTKVKYPLMLLDLPTYTSPVVFSTEIPQQNVKIEQDTAKLKKPKNFEDAKSQEFDIKFIQTAKELFTLNPLTFNNARVENVNSMLGDIEREKHNLGSYYYYLRLVQMHNKADVKIDNLKILKIKQKLKNWTELHGRPLNCLGLLNEELTSSFLQMLVIEKITTKFHDELIRSIIPALIGFLVHAPQVTCPMSEYLVELACKYPLSFGREILWQLLALPKSFLCRAVFSHLFLTIMSLGPALRKQIISERRLMDYIQGFMSRVTDGSKVRYCYLASRAVRRA